MSKKHTNLDDRPRALTIEALPHGGYTVREGHSFNRPIQCDHAAFARLTDAVGWIEDQMRLPESTMDVTIHGTIGR